MAKVKVFELAKEIGCTSKEVLAFLNTKGIEAKVAQSSIDEAAAGLVRANMGAGKASAKAETKSDAGDEGKPDNKAQSGAGNRSGEKPADKPEGRQGDNSGDKASEKPENKSDKKPENKAENKSDDNAKDKSAPMSDNKPQAKSDKISDKSGERKKEKNGSDKGRDGSDRGKDGSGDRGQQKNQGSKKNKDSRGQKGGDQKQGQDSGQKKKKKTIIFVSNQQNSKLSGGSRTQGNSGGQGGSSQGQGERRGGRDNRNQKSDAHRPLIRPLTPPSPTPTVDMVKPAQPQPSKKQKPVNEELQKQTARQAAPLAEKPARSEGGNEKASQNDRKNERGSEKNRGKGNDRKSEGGKGRDSQGGKSQSNENKRDDGRGSKRPDKNSGRDGQKNDKEQGGGRRPGKDQDRRKNNRDAAFEDGNARGKKQNRAGAFQKPVVKPKEEVEEQIKVITIPETITIKELAEKMKLQPSVIVKKLFLQGQMVTVNEEVSFETAEEIAIEYDIICEKEVKVDVIEELLKEDEEKEDDLIKRPPVVCVMGHVDHGKTSLLDAIRKTNVTDREAGGITQHIGAYMVTINGEKITFLDTPGHEAFTAMRMRGANSTDIAILVVAADDGVMPQTVEAINHAKAAGIEIIVAVNKIDKPNANVERVKQELTEHELIAVDWGGNTEFVPVSAKSGEGIDTLLETILLTAEILELKANPSRRGRGLVVEAELDKGRGPVATVLVQKGTLRVGDFISAGSASGKVRAMIDDKGRRIKEAGPSVPVEILGLSDVPGAGEIFIAHDSDKTAKSYADTYLAQDKEKKIEETKSKMSLDALFSQIQAGNLKELNIIVKADVQGSVEAVKTSLMKLSNEEVVVKCIHGGVGSITESDVNLASASNAIIIGFNVRPDVQAKSTAETEGVDIRLYKVIYQAIEDVEAAMKGMLDPVFEEKIIGHAEVRQIFKASAVGNIAGSYVLDGVFQRDCKVRITREGEQLFEGNLASLKRFKDDVKEVKAGFECGLVFEGYDQMQELDIVEAYIMVEVPR